MKMIGPIPVQQAKVVQATYEVESADNRIATMRENIKKEQLTAKKHRDTIRKVQKRIEKLSA